MTNLRGKVSFLLLGLLSCTGDGQPGSGDGVEIMRISQALSDEALPTIDFTLQAVIGQPSATEVMTNRIVPYAGFNIGGVHIDKSSSPAKIYVADVGNNRVLAFAGYQPQGTNANHILGQPSGFERGAPNGDLQVRRAPTAATLAFFNQPINSPTEEPVGVHLDTDAQGNLFVPDPANNRVLKYNNPFTDATPAIADDVWGQPGFTTLDPGVSNQSLRLETKFWVKTLGVDVDKDGNLWVADAGNHRVLAFRKTGGVISKQAAVCLGQPDCNSNGTSVFNWPVSVQVADDGTVYVLEGDQKEPDGEPQTWGNGRIMKFVGNLDDGYDLAATWLSGSLLSPRGMSLEGGTLWVGDSQNERVLKVSTSNGSIIWEFDQVNEGPHQFTGELSFVNVGIGLGSFGVDSGDILFGWHTRGASWGTTDYFPGLVRLSKTPPASGGDPTANALMLYHGDNQPTAATLASLHGMAVHGHQLFQSDDHEIKVYNDPQFMDGLVAPTFTLGKVGSWPRHVLTAAGGYLFVSMGPSINIYQLPIVQNHQQPIQVLTSGGNVTWVDDGTPASFDQISLGTGLVYDPPNDVLWVTDEPRRRVLRIKNPLGNPVVDMVLGQTSKTADALNGGASVGSVCKFGFHVVFTLALDNFGNLYVVDGSFEGGGNKRVLRFNASKLVPPPNNQIFYNPPLEADAVYARRTWEVRPDPPYYDHRPNHPISVTFDRDNHMYLLVDAYGDRPNLDLLTQVNNAAYERIYFYERPHLGSGPIEPDKVVKIPFGQSAFGHFLLGSPERFFVQDHTWNRVVQAHLLDVPSTYAPFQQDPGSDGLVSMEAEHHATRALPGGHDWVPAGQPGHSGDGALRAMPDDGTNNNVGYVSSSPRLDFKVKFVKTGTHYIWARGFGPNGNQDSYHAGLNGQAISTADRIGDFPNAWTWRKADMDGGQASFNVATAGEHTVNVWMREAGFIIDKVVITSNPAYTPTGNGPGESVRLPLPPASQKVGVATVTASAHDGNVPANTLDGSLATRWSALGDGQWIKFDLGRSTIIDKVKIAFHSGDVRQSFFDVHLSWDGVTWTPVLLGTTSSGTTLNLQEFDFPEAEARYVRVTGHGNSVNLWNSYTEVEVWGIPITGKLGATVLGASGFQSPNAPANTLDGNLATRWSADGVGQWISYDLGSAKTIEYLKLAFYQGDTRRTFFHVDVSQDGTNWSRIYSNGTSSGLNTTLETFNLPDSNARYLKVIGQGNSVNTWNSYTEVQVWGK